MRWVGCIRNIRYLRWTDLAGGHSVPVGADDQREAAIAVGRVYRDGVYIRYLECC